MNKPIYDNSKNNAFLALGYVSKKDQINDAMIQKYLRNDSATVEGVSNTIKSHYESDDILYFKYDENGDACLTQAFDEKTTAVFAIETGYYNANGDKIYAQYSKKSKGWSGVFFNSQSYILQNMNQYKIGIMSFVDFKSANKFICDLEKILLPGEVWKYSKTASSVIRRKTEFQILDSYLATVSSVLAKGNDDPDSLNYNKIKEASANGKRYVLFNTGLLGRYATDILIVGERDSSAKLQVLNPCIVTNGLAELAKYGFSMDDIRPEMISFFSDISEIVYDASVNVDLQNIQKLQHCIDDGIKRDRFPEECKRMYNDGDILGLMDKFKAAINRSLMIARRNYKYVIPQYRSSNGGGIQFLMPIYMLSQFDKTPDFALVLSMEDINGVRYYKPETVLELAWAYNNARAICKPDNTWLNPEKIEDCDSFMEEM